MQPVLTGKPTQLAVLDYGLFQVRENGRVIGICGYVIRTDAGEHVLIDTGFPSKYAADAKAATAEDELGEFGQVLSLGPENLAPAQLRLLGLTPDDVTLMIQSHTHIDHLGFMDGFPGVPIMMSAAERSLPCPLYWSGKQAMAWPVADYRLIAEDGMLGPNFEVFLCPGHAPGQLAFLVELPETGSVVLTSDAISRPEEIAEGFTGAWDEALAKHHGMRLMARAEDRNAFVIFGHCPAQWPTLKKAPLWYD
ncbi:MAG: MBL fold metallo-hydrolase [Pseudomonadota bacterium]